MVSHFANMSGRCDLSRFVAMLSRSIYQVHSPRPCVVYAPKELLPQPLALGFTSKHRVSLQEHFKPASLGHNVISFRFAYFGLAFTLL